MNTPAAAPASEDRGLALIANYKVLKSCAQAVGGLLLWGHPGQALVARAADLAAWVAEHAARASFVTLARWVVGLAQPHAATVLSVALLTDAALGFVEGWALHRRKIWAPWLIVVATAALMPYELYALARKLTLVRAGTLALNGAIVAYLATHALAHGRARTAGLRS